MCSTTSQSQNCTTTPRQTISPLFFYDSTNITNPAQKRGRGHTKSQPHQFMASMTSLKSTALSIILFFIQFSLIKAHGGHDDNDDDHDSDGGDQDHAELHAKGLILVKIWCLIILLVSTFAGGVSPYFYRWNESFLLLGTQFAGGVFLGTSMMHFLSDSNETFKDLTSKSYPFAFMLASAGYLLTMFGDCIINFVIKQGSEKETRVDVEEEKSEEVGTDGNPVFFRTSSIGDTILLILALCFHSVFEGIAIGVSGTYIEPNR